MNSNTIKNPFVMPLTVAAGILLLLIASQLRAGEYDTHGLPRLINRVIYEEGGVYKGSIPKMQSTSESGLKIAGVCKIASTTLKAIYGKDLNDTALYYSGLFGEVYAMALNPSMTPAQGAAALFAKGHSRQTAQWAGQRMSLIRSTLQLIHGDLKLPSPAGMPAFAANADNQDLTPAEFQAFMVLVKEQADKTEALTTNQAAALASSPAKLNGLVERCSFLIKSKIAGLLADPSGNNSEVPAEMKTQPGIFNPLNVGDLFLALGVHALYIQNPQALAKAGIVPQGAVEAALNGAQAKFVADSAAIDQSLDAASQGPALWDSAPLGPAAVN